jgi:uncharacterized protein YbaR (Trm112 family)
MLSGLGVRLIGREKFVPTQRATKSDEERRGTMAKAEISPWLLERLVCPLSKASVVTDGEWVYSTDPETRRRYPIRDGIPNMLIDESEEVAPAEFERIMTMLVPAAQAPTDREPS